MNPTGQKQMEELKKLGQIITPVILLLLMESQREIGILETVRNVFIKTNDKRMKGTFGIMKRAYGTQNHPQYKDFFECNNPLPIKSMKIQINAGDWKGVRSSKDKFRNNYVQDERLDLSPLLEVCSPLLEVTRSDLNGEVNISLDLALWKLGRKVPRIEKAKEKELTKVIVSQWNAWSVQNETKLQFIQSLPSDIATIQETWRQSENLKRIGDIIEKSEREEGRGGGSTTIKLSECTLEVKSKFAINCDSHAVKLFVKDTYLWIVNAYLNEGTAEQVQELFGEMKNVIPENEWDVVCCIGDFNINLLKDSNEKKLLEKLCKLNGLRVMTPNQPTRKESLLDFSILGRNIEIITHTVINAPSDHKAITWDFGVKKHKKRRSKFLVRQQRMK